MSGCATHGQLVGGYVLGALEPDEMEEMRRHVAECQHCGPETRELAGVPGLLDGIEPADVPPPLLPAVVEEAVLDRFARERRPRRRAVLPRRRVVAVAAACAAALALALALAWPTADDDESAYASAALAPTGPGADASAWASVEDVPAGTRVSLRARDLPTRPGGVYELWCVRGDGRWVSGGTFRSDPDGDAEAELTAAVRPGDYHVMVVTRRPRGAPKGERGTTVLRGRLKY